MKLIVSPQPYEGFRGCFVTAAHTSSMSRITYILLVLLETGELCGVYINVSCRSLRMQSGNGFDGDQRI
jgi:hypothetical protein